MDVIEAYRGLDRVSGAGPLEIGMLAPCPLPLVGHPHTNGRTDNERSLVSDHSAGESAAACRGVPTDNKPVVVVHLGEEEHRARLLRRAV